MFFWLSIAIIVWLAFNAAFPFLLLNRRRLLSPRIRPRARHYARVTVRG